MKRSTDLTLFFYFKYIGLNSRSNSIFLIRKKNPIFGFFHYYFTGGVCTYIRREYIYLGGYIGGFTLFLYTIKQHTSIPTSKIYYSILNSIIHLLLLKILEKYIREQYLKKKIFKNYYPQNMFDLLSL